MTTVIAILFFIVCLSLAYLSANREAPDSVTGSVTTQELETAPAVADDDLPPLDDAIEDPAQSDLPPAE